MNYERGGPGQAMGVEVETAREVRLLVVVVVVAYGTPVRR